MKKEQFVFRIWTADHVARLEAMWWQGIPASDIAMLLGGYTSQQVRDKVSREGFTRNPDLRNAPPATPEPMPATHDGEVVTMVNVLADECRWIYGEPLSTSQMCGNRSVKNMPWCEHHNGRAYQ